MKTVVARHAAMLRRGLLWLGLAMLAGCAATPISSERKLTGQEGAVLLKLVTNGMTATDPTETLSTVLILRERSAGERELSGDRVVLVRTRAQTSTTMVFSGLVEPGTYRFVHGMGQQGNVTYTFPLGRMLSGFEVKAGEVSLLGTLLVQPIGASRFVVGYVPPDAELHETFQQLFPALAAQTQGKPVHTLEMTAEMQRRAEIAPRFRRLSTALNGHHLSAEGGAYIGGRLGQLTWRPARSEAWRRADLGSWREVLTVRPYRGGLLAGGEEGLLRHSVDDGKTWRALSPPERGAIWALDVMPGGKLAALVQRDGMWTVHVTDDPVAGTWRKLASLDHERSINVGWQAPIPFVSGQRIGVAMPNGSVRLVDVTTGELSGGATGQSLVGIQPLADGTLVAQSIAVVRTTHMSTDGGKTWTDLNTSRFITAIAFRDRQVAHAVAPISPGMFPGEFALMTTRDGGRTWRQTGSVPGGTPASVRQLRIDPSDGALVAVLQEGMMRSTDEGKTWAQDL